MKTSLKQKQLEQIPSHKTIFFRAFQSCYTKKESSSFYFLASGTGCPLTTSLTCYCQVHSIIPLISVLEKLRQKDLALGQILHLLSVFLRCNIIHVIMWGCLNYKSDASALGQNKKSPSNLIFLKS